MIREYRFTCRDCAACAEPEDCVQCGELLEEMLLRLICVSGVDVDMGTGRLCIETDGSDDNALAEVLEDAGVYKNTPEGKTAFLKFVDAVNEQ